MNVPDPFESFILFEGEEKVNYKRDPKMPNSGIFVIAKEDHTLANLLRSQLLKSNEVSFSAYKISHPFEYKFTLKVQTTTNSSPLESLLTAVRESTDKIDLIVEQIKYALKN
ncbi:hypothetical protein HZS_6901 [Henneguya salminicola]|nr:hypothetical protein HZS_6901 [Henneguya salminicola]